MDPLVAKSKLQSIATRIGFDDCRVAPAGRARHADEFLSWVARGKAGDMKWLERNPERRTDPREILPGARAVVCLALNYYPGPQEPNPAYHIARYSWNDDYHDVIEGKLADLDLAMQEMGGMQRYYVDTGPVLERDFASEAGLGWNGKSTIQIHRKLGSWFFLAELITTLPLPPDPPQNDHCGKCTACLDACPTNAIPRPHFVDAPRCISYLTIEHKGSIPLELRSLIGNHLYGCDDCLNACPWNRFARTSRDLRFHARKDVFQHELRDFLALTDEGFRHLFRKSPIKRIKRPRFLRNVCVVLGNTGTRKDLPALRRACQDPD
ncbi:MAG: tRNA epoxyqueuosine(34) reductase QueG, partial [Roseibacillus sp.]|nr:tRNA epoxyqueuosine(34) reductase QueG [Roseibacillus sp.]